MRIGLITGEYPPMHGGVGDFTRELARALMPYWHEVHVITRTGRAKGRHAARAAPHVTDPTIHAVVPDWGWRSLWEMRELLHQLRLDVLDIQYQAAAFDLHPAINFFPVYSPCPTVVTFHDLRVPYLFPKAGPLRDWAVTLLARTADAAITTNRADELALIGRRVRRVARIPIGSNIVPALPRDYEREDWRAQMHIEPEDFLLGFFGFFTARKGVETLIRALGALDPYHHVLFIGGNIGSSDLTNRAYADRMLALMADLRLGERVHFTGYIPPTEVSAAFAALDLCVLPFADGISFHHGTLMAALAHGQAIVSTQPQLELPELAHGENVWLVPPQDVEALAAAVASLASNPMRRRALARGAARLSKRFSWARIAARTAAIFKHVR